MELDDLSTMSLGDKSEQQQLKSQKPSCKAARIAVIFSSVNLFLMLGVVAWALLRVEGLIELNSTSSGASSKLMQRPLFRGSGKGTDAVPCPCLKGEPGLNGTDGISGRPGENGTKGEKGNSGEKGATGPDGVAGLPGLKGDQGIKGSKGELGFRGNAGPKGDNGLPGNKGLTGIPGLKGESGLIGAAGAKGDKGSQGEPGLEGSIGVPGQTGLQGNKGIIGQRGLPGLTGQKGEKGIQGETGNSTHGEPGIKGDIGLPGIVGPRGHPGVGSAGLPGIKGERGLQGGPGLKGNQGANGIPGVNGEKGIQGEQGLKGGAGVAGQTGLNGSDGDKGEPGLPGLSGQKGEKGIQGETGNSIKGDPGSKGDIGLPGVAGVVGSSGITGPPGSKGETGMPGSPGIQGASGIQGVQGEKGDTGVQGGQGLKGERGSNGALGNPGIKGHSGLKGDHGLKGIEGIKGSTGLKGDKGVQGLRGEKGNEGRYPLNIPLAVQNGSVRLNGTRLLIRGESTLEGYVEAYISGQWGYPCGGFFNSSTDKLDRFIHVVCRNLGLISVSGSGQYQLGSRPISNADCDFENTLCSWQQATSDDFDWQLASGSTPSSGTGPSGDHTAGSGYYAFIETSSPRLLNDTAQIISPLLGSTNGTYMSFWYHMYGDDVHTLNLYIRDSTSSNTQTPTLAWSQSGNQGNKWMCAQVNIVMVYPYRLIFEGVRGRSYQGDIAIDDIKYYSACPSAAATFSMDNINCQGSESYLTSCSYRSSDLTCGDDEGVHVKCRL